MTDATLPGRQSADGDRPSRWVRALRRATPALIVVALIGVVGAWFWSAVQTAREAARRTQCYGNYKGISLALLWSQDERGELPAAWTVDSDGRRLHSWRLTVMAFLDGNDLLANADLSAPWDAPRNAALLPRRPLIWGCPSHPEFLSENAHKAAVTGPDTAFPGSTALRLDDITDGLGNTVYAGEVTHRIPWTKPEDVDAVSHPQLGMPGGFDGPHRDGVPFGFLDGSYRFLSRNTDPDVLRRMFRRNDDEAALTPQ